MTPEACAAEREIRTVTASPGAEELFLQSGQPALLRMTNQRGSFEVLVAPEKPDALDLLLTADVPLNLTGFWRRRSGLREDGSRHFIWCLVLLDCDIAEDVSLPMAA